MLEKAITNAVSDLLRGFVDMSSLDKQNFQIKAWSGKVQLTNLRLLPQALEQLDLPVTVVQVKAARYSGMSVVPLSKTRRQPNSACPTTALSSGSVSIVTMAHCNARSQQY